MTTINNINELEVETLQKILNALEKSFPKELGLKTTDVGILDWKIPEIGIYYKSPTSTNDLSIFVEKITKEKNIRSAYAKIFEQIEIKRKQKSEASTPKQEDKTTINKDESKSLIEEAEKRDRVTRESQIKAKEDVARKTEILEEIKKQQDLLKEKIIESEKIKASLKDSNNQDKKVYVKVDYKTTPKFTDDQQKAFDGFQKEAISNPKETLYDLTKKVEERTYSILKEKGLTDEEIKFISKQTATKIVENIGKVDDLSYIHSTTEAAILKQLSVDGKILPTIITDKNTLTSIKNIANDVSLTNSISDTTLKNVTTAAFGETFATKIFGLDPNQIQVTFSNIPLQGFNNEINFNTLNENYQKSLKSQGDALNLVKNYGTDKAKGFLLQRAGTFLESRIATLSPESVIGKLLRSPEAKSLFYSTFGVGSPIAWEATGFFGNLVLNFAPNAAPLFSGITKLTGINFGIAPVVSTSLAGAAPVVTPLAVEAGTQAVTQTAGQIAGQTAAATTGKVATQVAVKGVSKGILSTIFAGLGSLAGWVTFGLSTIAGWLFGKILEKINWNKVKEFFKEKIFPVAIAGGGILIGGPVGFGLIAGGTFLLIGPVKRGIIGRYLVTTIATPVIVAILSIPPIIALFMLVINSGAYIVPSGISAAANIVNPYIEVILVATPAGPFENKELPLSIDYLLTIRAKKGILQNINLDYECSVVKDGPEISCPNIDKAFPTTIEDISPTKEYTFSYKQQYNEQFKDSLPITIVTVAADVEDQKGAKSSASATIKIGTPPDSCPSIWPVDGFHIITQTSGGSYSHKFVEAIDIGSLSIGSIVKATHSGIATLYESSGVYGPKYIDITSICGGNTITTRYAHLSGFTISNGSVSLGQIIGSSGFGGTGPHLHYEFVDGLKMVPPYIPKELPRNCSDNTGICGYIP